MRIDIIGKHLTVTDAIRTYAEQKVGKLTKFFDGVQLITARLEQDPHKKGFHAEVVVDVVGHDDFVGNAHHADLYTAIDDAAEKAGRQLSQYKDKLRDKRGSTPAGGSGGV